VSGKKISFANFKHDDKSIFQEKELYEIIQYSQVEKEGFVNAIRSIYELNTEGDD
jgi:hypothetical protein